MIDAMSADPIIGQYHELFDLDSAPWSSSMHFGLQVESEPIRGIIERLCERLRPLSAAARDEGLDFKILSVKEKFGTLRVAYRDATEAIEAEIQEAKSAALILLRDRVR
jgi:hypothetical protein